MIILTYLLQLIIFLNQEFLIKHIQMNQRQKQLRNSIFFNLGFVQVINLLLQQQQFLMLIQKLLQSRRRGEEAQQKIQKLQPQKYGKGAFYDLTYTPSKLADHILFKEANYLKKIEEQASKVRRLEAQNKIIGDQVEFIKRQRDGIQKSLNKMIAMYKSIMGDMETKNQERIRGMQVKFREELQKIIKEKEEEARYVQSEKQLYEERIAALQKILEEQRQDIKKLSRNKSDVMKDLDELTINHNHLTEKFNDLNKRSQEDAERAAQQIIRLKKDFMNAEVDWKDRLREQIQKKDKQIQKIERMHKAELQKVENQRQTQNLLKNQEINELTKTFEAQSMRMKDIIQNKDKMINTLSIENNKQKARLLSLTREYQLQIYHLTHEKNKLLEEIQFVSKDNEGLITEKTLVTQQLQKENIKLRDLLYESSMQLEKTKSELVSLARDNTRLINRVKSTEQQAKTWRESYYINKNRPA